MRNRCAALFVLLALGAEPLLALGAEPLLAANYQFQALIDLDGDATNGCAVEVGETNLHGSELRAFARTDRTQVLEVVLQSCRDARWHDELRSLDAVPIGLGQGEIGSDRIRWSLPLSRFAALPHLSFNVVSERLDQPANDILNDGAVAQILALDLGDSARPLPALSGIGLLFAALAILWMGRRKLRHIGRHAPWVMALPLILGAIL